MVRADFQAGEGNGTTAGPWLTGCLDQGIIDSTGVLEVIGFLESTFGITVEDAEMLPDFWPADES